VAKKAVPTSWNETQLQTLRDLQFEPAQTLTQMFGQLSGDIGKSDGPALLTQLQRTGKFLAFVRRPKNRLGQKIDGSAQTTLAAQLLDTLERVQPTGGKAFQRHPLLVDQTCLTLAQMIARNADLLFDGQLLDRLRPERLAELEGSVPSATLTGARQLKETVTQALAPYTATSSSRASTGAACIHSKGSLSEISAAGGFAQTLAHMEVAATELSARPKGFNRRDLSVKNGDTCERNYTGEGADTGSRKVSWPGNTIHAVLR
jgi:hypothetical protein